MRTFLLAALLVSVATPAVSATRNFGITGFEQIRVDGPFKVRLATGIAPFAKATGSPAALDGVSVDVQGRTLIVRPNQSSWGGYPGKGNGPVEITLGTHELSAAWLNGSGVLAIDKVKGLSFDLSVDGSGLASIGQADVDQLRLSVAGTGGATIAGRAGSSKVVVSGIASLDASGLSTKDTAIKIDGPATVKAAVTNSAKVDGNGPATITFTGNPACTLRVSGSATVNGCKS